MHIKLLAMSTLLTSAARWIISRYPKQALALSVSPLPSKRWSSSISALGSNREETNVGGPTALIFDTETTGMVRFREHYQDPSQPDLIQLGFLMVDTSDWRIRNQGSFLVQLRDNADSGIEVEAQRIHGISEQDCSDFGIQHETALDIFENLCSKADFLVGHNIRFDAMVMQTAFYRGQRNSEDILSSKKQICTMMQSINLCKLPSKTKSSSYKWPSLAEAYKYVTGGDRGEEGESLEGAHDALVDSQACLNIFRYLVENGHVSLELPDDTERKTETTSFQENISTTVVSNVFYSDVSSPSLSYTENTNDRNGGDDRSREIEEAEYHRFVEADSDEYVDQSIETDKAASFDSASDSSDRNVDNNARANHATAIDNAEGFRVRGNTYEHREMIKQLGGRWNSRGKEWVFRENRYLAKLESFEDLDIVRFSEEEVRHD